MSSAAVKRYLEAQLPQLQALLGGQTSGGMQLAQRASDVMDELLRRLYQSALTSTASRRMPALMLAAVGGYGRRTLGWKSDLDVRLLCNTEPESLQSLAEAIFYPLWDAGVSIGHQVITIDSVLDDAERDLPSATALLDFRWIAGDHTLQRALTERAYARLFAPGNLAAFTRRLQAEARARRKRLDDCAYLLEPEVKNGPGGLRELDIALWAAAARFRTADLAELCGLGVLEERDADDARHALEFLWSLRNRLHRDAGRKSDRLTFAEQEVIAAELGYATPNVPGAARDSQSPAALASKLMTDYQRATRAVARVSQLLFSHSLPLPNAGARRLDLGHGFFTDGESIGVADCARLRAQPALALQLLAAGVEHGLPLHDAARDAIEHATADAAFGNALRADAEAASLFVKLVSDTRRAPFRSDSILMQLHDLGLLTAMIPEFAPLVGKAHHDVYHVYAVDHHSIAAVDQLRALARGELSTKYPLASRLVASETVRAVLFLATLLHDVGKAASGPDHASRGAHMVRAILTRLGQSAGVVEQASLLVQEHLSMYRTALHRDLEDGTSVARFAHLVRDARTLADLYLLTVVDVCTTSPTSMTNWKLRMLDGLYFATEARLEGVAAVAEPRRFRLQEQLSALDAPTLDQGFVEEFFDTMPARYQRASTPAEIMAHARAARDVRDEAVLAALVPSRHHEVAELCIVSGRCGDQTGVAVLADDRPGLLAAITAAIAANHLEVLAAEIHTRRLADGSSQAVDLFWVRDPIEGAARVTSGLPRLEQDLKRVLAGQIAPRELLQSRRASRWSDRPSPAVRTQIRLDHGASADHTVIEVFTKDQPGVLFTLASALHELAITIALAKISTEGARVTDAFYVTEADGRKLDPGQRSLDVHRSLLAALRAACV
jgi:[protein-PII] uridylyltransferase